MRSSIPVVWSLAALLCISVPQLNAQFPLINCPPQPVSSSFFGGITSTALALQEFCCLLGIAGLNPTDVVVTLVARADAIANINLANISLSNPPLFGDFATNRFFAAQSTTLASLCTGTLPFGSVILGDALFCLQNPFSPFCPGPLPSGLSYRVALLVYRNGVLTFVTPWSDPITLKNPQDFRKIETKPQTRSASMIVITTILPVLTALLLAILLAAIFLRCCCCCTNVFAPKQCQQD